VGKDRSTVANLLRLLSLPEEIQQAVRVAQISLGHAKALLSVEDRAKQLGVYQAVMRQGLSVRQTEALAGTWMPAKRRRSHREDPHTKALEDELRRALGTKVRIIARHKGGRIIVDSFSTGDLTRIVQALGAST
jgi:ParB family chromosome partitioning protein